jgi:hypothetical protein
MHNTKEILVLRVREENISILENFEKKVRVNTIHTKGNR